MLWEIAIRLLMDNWITPGKIAKISLQSELQGGEEIAPLNCVYPLAERLTVD